MMEIEPHVAIAKEFLKSAGVEPVKFDERSFPGERWLIVLVPKDQLIAAQSLAGDLECALNAGAGDADTAFAVTFRPVVEESNPQTVGTGVDSPARGRLFNPEVDQLVQLLEARSRTSDALPSLRYVEDPRVGPVAVAASRHQLIFGRRGVGKTALMLEAKRIAESQGHVCVWLNAHVLREMTATEAFIFVAELALKSLARQRGTSSSPAFARLEEQSEWLARHRGDPSLNDSVLKRTLPVLNEVLRGVLRSGVIRLYIYLDDFYLFPTGEQAKVLDYLAGALRDCDGWLKVASIERLTRPFEPSSRIGLEIPHDATKLDLDMTLEDPGAAQKFLESMLSSYTIAAGIKRPGTIAKTEALGRLVLGSGAVPRDYINLFASSIVVAREQRREAQEIGKEDVAVAAGRAARSKKRDLEQDVKSEDAPEILTAINYLSETVKSEGYTYFLVDISEKTHPNYDLLGRVINLRFAHLVNASISHKHRPGVRYEAYVLDLSEYTDVRLKRGLNVLDLEDGTWTWRLTGKGRTQESLTGTQFRDKLRLAPVIEMDRLLVQF